MSEKITARCSACSALWTPKGEELMFTSALCPACRQALHGGVSMTPEHLPNGVTSKARSRSRKDDK